MDIKLNLLDTSIEESDFLSSHFFGCPDVPEKWNDDAVFYNDEIFICQLNLSEINNPLLPNKGMLYFFIQVMSHPYRGMVRYTDNLDNMERVDFNEGIDSPYNLLVDSTISIISDKSNIELLPSSVNFKEYHQKKDEVILLHLNFNDYPTINVFKDIDEEVCFMIKKVDLEKNDFSKTYLSLNLDN